MSQNTQVLDWLTKGNTITQMEATARWRMTRLGARIKDLRERGHAIHTELVDSGHAGFGRYARYSYLGREKTT